MQSLFFRLNLIIMRGFFFFFLNNLLWGAFKGKLIPATANTLFFYPLFLTKDPCLLKDLGKFDDVLEPGCHCLPCILGQQLAGHLSLCVQQLDLWCETKTNWLLQNRKIIVNCKFKMLTLSSHIISKVYDSFFTQLLFKKSKSI